MKSLGLVGRAQGRQRSPTPVCARYSHVFLLATIPCTGPFLPAPSDHYSAYLCLRRRKGPASRCQRPEANVPLTTSYLFFSRWVRETEVAGPSKPLRGGGGVGWGAPLVSTRRDGSPRRAAAVGEGGVGARPPSPASPRASHDIRCRGARRAQARAKEAGGRGRVALLGRALLRPARSLRPAPPVPSCPRRASGVHNATVAHTASAALGCAAHPASSLSAVAAVGHAAAGRGRAAAGESGARAANPSPSGSRTARRLPSPSYSPLPAPSPLPPPPPLRAPAASTMSAGGDFGNPLRKFKLVFLGEQSGEYSVYSLGSEPTAFPMPPLQSPHWGPSQPRLTKALPRPGGGGKGCRWGNGAGSGGAGLGRIRGKGWRRLRGQGMKVRVGSG